MEVTTINIALDVNLVNQLDFMAKEQARSRDEIISNSLKMQLSLRQRFDEMHKYGAEVAKKLNLTEEDIFEEIRNYRKGK